MQITVIGSSSEYGEMFDLSYSLGKELAKIGYSVICGGRGGIMEGISKGISESGGLVVGVIPGSTRRGGNGYLSAEIVTGMGEMRNFILILSGDLIVAFPGSYGTMSELAFGMRNNKNIILVRPELHDYKVDGPNIYHADNLSEILKLISELDDI